MEAVSEVCDWLRQVKEGSTQSTSDQSVGKFTYLCHSGTFYQRSNEAWIRDNLYSKILFEIPSVYHLWIFVERGLSGIKINA